MTKHSNELKNFYIQFKKFEFEEDEIDVEPETWDKEWEEIVERTMPIVEKNQKFLEEIHVFALANLLKRTIVIFTTPFILDMNEQPLSPNRMGGIYIPNLFQIDEPYQPLLISYWQSHFSILFHNERSVSKMLPLCEGENYPKTHFTSFIGTLR